MTLAYGSVRTVNGENGMSARTAISSILRYRTESPFPTFATALAASIALPLVLVLYGEGTPARIAAALIFVFGVVGSTFHLKREIDKLTEKAAISERMLASLPCYAFALDGDLNILWSSDLFRRDFGVTAGRRCHEAMKGLDAPCGDCTARQCLKDGHIHSAERTVERKDGETLDMMFYSAPVRDERGKILAVLEIAVDITDVKELQRRLALVGSAVAGMAHSIKNIMMGLDGGIYIVNRGLEADDPAEIKEGWEVVEFNFEKIRSIVQDILYCSREREPDFKMIKPNEIVEEVHELFRETARSYNIELRIETDERLDEAVIDPKGLHTVLANLVSNAIDACKADIFKDEHTVTIRTRKGTDGSTIVEVSDNGIGLTAEAKERAFEDFFTSKGNQGTGLGLMVTQKILEEHGGRITFESEYGNRTTFLATFPPRTLDESDEGSDVGEGRG